MWGIGIPSQMKDRIFEKGILNPKFILKCNPKFNAVAWRWLDGILTLITKIPQQSWTSLKVEEASRNMARKRLLDEQGVRLPYMIVIIIPQNWDIF